ncbi:iron-sulfur cluster assembly accessory protein [Notoacmeibacter sp. MSK16QG-6]|uniref:HesB/IscA family protein n=1 Tax=Notoacmeibacter sp. MSK16QG-6 TaxID=2957982 RepID=UPI00209D0EEE|nr:iron-sulfur cluster assembly accessory protein [Notoacmeibacter sp. MSK16QG-6]MCP1199396.1 iron-sulfur cluster assembly accessory protein [Notoacmeibacter sp. MSK16QG-6]
MNAIDRPDKTIMITENAARRITKVVAGSTDKIGLRVTVEGGGCSGFSYAIDLTDSQQDDDRVFERDGAKVFVDELSMVYMAGSKIDFVDDLIGQAFQIDNPNAVASCGCGTSFSI